MIKPCIGNLNQVVVAPLAPLTPSSTSPPHSLKKSLDVALRARHREPPSATRCQLASSKTKLAALAAAAGLKRGGTALLATHLETATSPQPHHPTTIKLQKVIKLASKRMSANGCLLFKKAHALGASFNKSYLFISS